LQAQAAALAELKIATPMPEITLTPPPAVVEAPVPATPPEPAAPAKQDFLGFQLPSESFAFDKRQKFQVVPALSRVGFDAKSTLHDFSGVTTKVDGQFTVNLARAQEKPTGTISAEAAALDTGLADRDEDMRKTLATEQYKTLEFQWTGFEPSAVDAQAMTLSGNVTGKLTIRGKTREISMPVKVSVDASKRVAIEGETKIKLADYDVAPPSQLGVIKVEDEVKIWIALRARLVGLAKDGE
jgi:polyisoprenoid-binding protein YceI